MKTKYDKQGESGLGNKSTAARNHPRKVPAEIVAKIVHLRRKYHLGLIRNVGRGKIHTKRYQYTAIDDATKVRALKIYPRHNQANACDFVDYFIEKLTEWENFYNFHRPHGAFAGKTPYEILRDRLQ